MIIGLCIVVAISGNITLVNSDSILKKSTVNKGVKPNYSIFVDLSENRFYIRNGDKIVNSYPISLNNLEASPPIGSWKIIKKVHTNNNPARDWLEINVPWGKYSIIGSAMASENQEISHLWYFKLFEDDFRGVYKEVAKGTSIKIYGGALGVFGGEVRNIRPGDRGSDVYEIEKKLTTLGYFKGIVNGIYNNDLKNAIYKFENNNGLKMEDTLGREFYEKIGIEPME